MQKRRFGSGTVTIVLRLKQSILPIKKLDSGAVVSDAADSDVEGLAVDSGVEGLAEDSEARDLDAEDLARVALVEASGAEGSDGAALAEDSAEEDLAIVALDSSAQAISSISSTDLIGITMIPKCLMAR